MRNLFYLLLAAAIFFTSIWQASAPVAANQSAAEQQQISQTNTQALPDFDIRVEVRIFSRHA